MTLHEELAIILEDHGNAWMTTTELAGQVNRRRNYKKRDGSEVSAFQVHGRTRNYGGIFERDGSRVRLRVSARGRPRLELALPAIEANLATYRNARSAGHRYASFDYCFNYFQSWAEAGRATELTKPANLEVSCLQLGFYLASWGMYRGSSVRLQRSVAYLTRAVDEIAAAPTEIWAADADDYSDEVCSLILEMADRLQAAFDERASETLATKVMLGVFGCVPAFDAYFKRGIGVSRLNHASLRRIADFHEANSDLIERNRVRTLEFGTESETTRRYSRAKVIDMIFFVAGAPQKSTL